MMAFQITGYLDLPVHILDIFIGGPSIYHSYNNPNPQSDLQLKLPRVLLVTMLFYSQVGP